MGRPTPHVVILLFAAIGTAVAQSKYFLLWYNNTEECTHPF